MIVNVKHKRLNQALAGSSDRIVLGGGFVEGYVLVILAVWVGAAIGLALWLGGGELSSGMIPGVIALAYLVGGWKSRLTLDLTARTYLHEYGLVPFVRRRQGYLDEFDHLSLMREERKGGEGGSYAIWKLTLTPKEGAQASQVGSATAVATAPIVLEFSWRAKQTAAVMLDLAQTLSQTTALPLQDEPPPPAPTPRAPGRAGWGCLLCVVGLIGLGNAYSWYECRGAHFPVRPGAPLVIDHRMGTCTVRSLEVTAGQSYRRTGGCGSEGSGVCFYDVTPYAISLDIENTGSKPSTLHFVVGFGASNRTEGDSGPLQPHTHRRVTVNLEKSGDAPKDLFLRADG